MKFILLILLLATLTFSYEKYDREEHFGRWRDFDHDCQNTRQEVLIRDAVSDVVAFKHNRECSVDSGLWYGAYTDSMYTDASDLDIEHVVPLKQAWISGAWAWTYSKRVSYANYLTDERHLIAVADHHNQAKGSKAPHEWMPPNMKYWKEYCRIWIRIKVQWDLTVSIKEFIFIQNILKDETHIYPKIRLEP